MFKFKSKKDFNALIQEEVNAREDLYDCSLPSWVDELLEKAYILGLEDARTIHGSDEVAGAKKIHKGKE